MHARKLACCLTSALLLLATLTVSAVEYGARAYGMGGAYNALSSGVSSLVHNPAGIGAKRFDVTASVWTTDTDLVSSLGSALVEPVELDGDCTLSALAGVGVGSVAVGAWADGKYQTKTDGANRVLDTQVNKHFALGTGFGIISVPLNAGGLRMGLEVQHNQGERTQFVVDPETRSVVQKTEWNGKGHSLSAGFQVNITSMVTLGIATRDLVAQTQWTGTTTTGEETKPASPYVETPKPVSSGGIAFKVPGLKITLAVEGDTTGTVRLGGESNLFFNAVSLRAGQIRPKDGKPTNTVGLGFNLGPLSAGIAAGSKNGFTDLEAMVADASIRF